MSFLTIPNQEGLFIPIRRGRSAEDDGDNDDDEEDEEEEEEEEEDVRLIPRCSPVPRKRGASIHDETAEYLRIQAGLSPGKRVSFADTTGGDLVDVREFFNFDSDDEEDSAKWEEERAKYGKYEREPVFHVHPDFEPPSGEALLQDVRAHKVAIELISPVEDEPLAFCGLVRVLNISFHKAVYIRSTMDNWATYFDHPAEYVHGSHDGDTDKFSFKLSFAPPFITHGSRIEFVVRYETTEGDFWANNAHMNYMVTLILAYDDDDDDTEVINSEVQEIRGILRPPREYSIRDYFDSSHNWKSEDGTETPEDPSPVIMAPEVAVEERRVLEELDRKQQLL
uniref:protein phosphatase 1 regulatory subunit 3A isoform X2 n=1 Tax=Doryrhamphus excisus TaxID=161450 RepID=UPI0025ADBF10|nr:protein phosphatase 1 regulatory subunit 3A isoform X2 [Doryrhamphus excisus]